MIIIEQFLTIFGYYYRNVDILIGTLLDNLSFIPYLIIAYVIYFLLDPKYGSTIAERFVIGIYGLVFHLFFRTAKITGAEKIPKRGPVLFVCAPHANQYLDGIVTTYLFPRKIYFMVADVSFTKRIIGYYIRNMNTTIPVSRAQDYAKKGDGTIKIEGKLVTGLDTHFTQYQAEFSILVNKISRKITKIVSDTELEIAEELNVPEFTEFKYFPKVDHNDLYKHVFNAFNEDKSLCIFPEGGSHDRTQLLKFFPGCASIPLHYLAENPDKILHIVPVGMNYFNGHRFRSRVNVVVGDPFVIKQSDIDRFRDTPSASKEIIGGLLEQVTAAVRNCIVEMYGGETDYLNLWIARQLYTPHDMELSLEDKTELSINFSKGYRLLKDEEDVEQFKNNIEKYKRLINTFGLRDDQVRNLSIESSLMSKLKYIFVQSMYVFVLFVCAVPGYVLMFIPGGIASLSSKYKAREALKNSNVKLIGTDVMGTWKVALSSVIFPIFIIFNAIVWNILRLTYYHLKPLTSRQLFTFIFLQPFIMYFGVRCYEVGIKKIRMIWIMILSMSLYTTQYIYDMREELHNDIKKLVEKYGPKIFGDDETFQKNRVLFFSNKSNRQSQSFSQLNRRLSEISDEIMKDNQIVNKDNINKNANPTETTNNKSDISQDNQ